MGMKQIKPKTCRYSDLPRGTSVSVPVVVRDPFENPIDLTGMHVAFTLKHWQGDSDFDDRRAFIAKDFDPQEAANGKFYVRLTSDDTNIPPGEYYFDIEIHTDGGAVWRLVTLQTTVVAGPSNRWVNTGEEPLPVGDAIQIIVAEIGNPIVVVTPIIATQTASELIAALDARISALETQNAEQQKEINYQAAAQSVLNTTVADLSARVTALENQTNSINKALINKAIF